MGTIDDYLATLADADRSAIARVYRIATDAVPDAEQGTGYRMPALLFDGKALLSVMRTKTHLGVYPFSADAVAAVRPRLDGFDVSTGTIRFTLEHPLPDDVVRDLVLFRRDQIIRR
ncbi:iron chaperone [Microbacterium sp. NPDC012755]|uniref:iron chaperone n=1 Tax=Microbacterium sp. NPDC012755 TaxID=3364184 RepID=UPI003687A378